MKERKLSNRPDDLAKENSMLIHQSDGLRILGKMIARRLMNNYQKSKINKNADEVNNNMRGDKP
jgi:hypothetical protein